MEEREIRAVTRISPMGKLAIARPAVGKRELAYKLKQYERNEQGKKRKLNLNEKKQGVAELAAESEPQAVPKAGKKSKDPIVDPQAEDFVADLKKRISFDRAMIIGDEE